MFRPQGLRPLFRYFIFVCARATLRLVLGIGLLLPSASLADPARRSFDIPAGDASITLKLFAAQSNEQLLYSPDDVRGVQTQAVRGDLSPLTTLEAMLDGTNLRLRQDAETHAIAVTVRPVPRAAETVAVPTAGPAGPKSSLSAPPKKLSFLSAWLGDWLNPGQPASAGITPAAAQLAKFDLNKNGVIDPAERPAYEAELSAEKKPDGKVPIVLNAFEVNTSQDRGYAAGNTLSGGRIDTPLALTPAPISVMTKEFMDDFGILDVNDAAQFAIGMDLANPNNELPFGGNRNEFSFRGADRAGNYPTRDGVQQYFVADSYNSERFEFSRGPNALMFGVGGPGGMVGSGSKQARFNTRSVSTSFRADSFGGYRGTLDYQQGFDRFAVRVNALHQNIMTWQDRTSSRQNAITVQAKYRITNRTTLSAQFERSSESNRQYAKSYAENASLWDRTTVNTNNTQIAGTPGTFGLGIISPTNDRMIYNTSTQTLLNYRGFQYQTVGLGFRIPWQGRPEFANFATMGKNFNLGPIDNMAERDNLTRMVILDHAFSPNLTARLLWNSSDIDSVVPFVGGVGPPSDYRIDVNRLFPNGATNPNFGKAYADQVEATQAQQNGSDDWALNLNYTFLGPKWWGLRQRLNISGGYRVERFESWSRSWRWVNNPAQPNPTSNVNALVMRYYYDNPGVTVKGVVNERALNGLDPSKTWRNIQSGFNLMERTITANGQVTAETAFFNDRLVFSYGGRRDRVARDQLNAIGNDAADGYALIQGNTNPATGMPERGFVAKSTSFRTSKNAGVVAYPFPDRLKWLRPAGIVLNLSENFQPVSGGNPLLSGKNPDAPHSQTEDFGIRYSIPGGVAYAEVRRYNTKQLGVLGNFGSIGEISNIWINLGYTDVAHTAFGPYRDVSARELSGYEFEITANPSRQITLTANYSHPSVRTIADSIDRRAYVAAHLAEWQAGAAAQPGQIVNGRTIIDPAVIRQAILNIENSFNGSTAGTLGNGARHRASFSGRYTFTEGKLRGTGMVLGVTYRGHNKSGSRDAQTKFNTTAPTSLQNAAAAWDYLWTPPVWTTTAGLNHTRRFGKTQMRFQLNVSNVLNSEKPQWSSYSTIGAGTLTPALAAGDPNRNPRMQVLSGFNLPEPRKVVFTTTMSF